MTRRGADTDFAGPKLITWSRSGRRGLQRRLDEQRGTLLVHVVRGRGFPRPLPIATAGASSRHSCRAGLSPDMTWIGCCGCSSCSGRTSPSFNAHRAGGRGLAGARQALRDRGPRRGPRRRALYAVPRLPPSEEMLPCISRRSLSASAPRPMAGPQSDAQDIPSNHIPIRRSGLLPPMLFLLNSR
jgi:hypothetical protein